jgi:hypothetical protein
MFYCALNPTKDRYLPGESLSRDLYRVALLSAGAAITRKISWAINGRCLLSDGQPSAALISDSCQISTTLDHYLVVTVLAHFWNGNSEHAIIHMRLQAILFYRVW